MVEAPTQLTQAKTEIQLAQFKTTGAFRIGQTTSQKLFQEISRRDDMGYFWTTGIVELAFRNDFEIVDQNDEPAPWMDKWKDGAYIDEIMRGVSFERIDGSTAFVWFTSEKKDEPPILYPFPQDQTHFQVDEKGDIIEFQFSEHIGGGFDPFLHIINKTGLKNVFHEVLRPCKIKYQGRSVLEVIWDLIQERRILFQSAGILSARVASGIRVATLSARDDSVEDAAVVTVMETGLSKVEGDDVSLILRAGTDAEGNKWEDRFEIIGGPDYDFLEKLDMIHRGLALAMNVPKNYLDGIFQGSLMGAETILQLLHASLRKIQDDWSHRLTQLVKRWCELTGNAWSPQYKLVWELKPVLTDMEEAQVDNITAQTIANLFQAGIIELEEARKHAPFDLKPNVLVDAPVAFGIKAMGKDKPKEEEE